MRGRNRYLAVFAVLAFVGAGTFLFGCFGSDDEDIVVTPPPPPPLSGFALTPATMQQAASISAGAVDLFSQIALLFAGVAQNIPAPPVLGPVPRLPVPLGASGLCLPGATLDNVTWNDNDNDTLPSAGDTITVELQNCALVADGGQSIIAGNPNPAVTFTVASVAPVLAGTLSLNIISAPALDPTDTTTITGVMPATFSALNFPAATVTLGQISGTAANTQLQIVDTLGPGNLTFGCFDVNLTFPDALDPFVFDTSVRGVAKIGITPTVSQIMQLGDYAAVTDPSPLNFIAGTPFSGQLKLLSFDSRPNFQLPACYGSVTGTTSGLVTALGGSSIQLDQFNNISWTLPADNTINTTWSALIN